LEYHPHFYFDILQPEVRESVYETINDLRQNGVKTKAVSTDFLYDLLDAFNTIIASEAFSAFEKELKEQPDKIDQEVRSRILVGKDILASDYIHAIKAKYQAVTKLRELFKEVDVILAPNNCTLPTDIGQREISIDGEKMPMAKLLSRITRPMNAAGFPSMSIPGIAKN
jgi:aspartyl-tRNA(Asn)/glutamyl-tRNA(Gln) amidotransferase subunit A